MKLDTFLRFLCLGITAGVLAGCAARDPVGYLPENTGYLSLNMEQALQQEGAARALKALRDIGKTPEFDSASRIYVGISRGNRGPGISPYGGLPFRWYCVVTGKPGVTREWLGYFKSNGGTDVSIEGRKCLRFSDVIFLPLNDSAFAFAPGELSVRRMLRVGKKKEPGAAGHEEFRILQQTETTCALAAAMNASSLAAQFTPQLGLIAMINPQASSALQNLDLAVATMNWSQKPQGRLDVRFKDADQATALAQLLRIGMGQLLGSSEFREIDLANFVQIQSEGPIIRADVTVKQELADRGLANLEKFAAELEQNPDQRKELLDRFLRFRSEPSPQVSGPARGESAPAPPQPPNRSETLY